MSGSGLITRSKRGPAGGGKGQGKKKLICISYRNFSSEIFEVTSATDIQSNLHAHSLDLHLLPLTILPKAEQIRL